MSSFRVTHNTQHPGVDTLAENRNRQLSRPGGNPASNLKTCTKACHIFYEYFFASRLRYKAVYELQETMTCRAQGQGTNQMCGDPVLGYLYAATLTPPGQGEEVPQNTGPDCLHTPGGTTWELWLFVYLNKTTGTMILHIKGKIPHYKSGKYGNSTPA